MKTLKLKTKYEGQRRTVTVKVLPEEEFLSRYHGVFNREDQKKPFYDRWFGVKPRAWANINSNTIYLNQEHANDDRLVLHEIGHIHGMPHTILPSIMNPVGVFRWQDWENFGEMEAEVVAYNAPDRESLQPEPPAFLKTLGEYKKLKIRQTSREFARETGSDAEPSRENNGDND